MSKITPSSLDISEFGLMKKSFARPNKTMVIIHDIGISFQAVED